jgi:hypothetical protein
MPATGNKRDLGDMFLPLTDQTNCFSHGPNPVIEINLGGKRCRRKQIQSLKPEKTLLPLLPKVSAKWSTVRWQTLC